MSDDALIRLENLKATKLSPTELVRRVGSSVSYWSDLLAGRKSFGEKTARKIETGLGLARGSLDEPGSGATPKDVTETQYTPSGAALDLAALFDEIPAGDVIRRSEAHSAATQAILAVLRAVPETSLPSKGRQKRSA